MSTDVALPIDGTTIEYTDRPGTGEPILLIHAGVFSDWFTALAADPALAGRRVIRIRRAGYTAGPAPAAHLTVGDHARHCAVLLERLGVDGAQVVAHSSGCVIALQLALDRPDLVRSLVLSEPPLLDNLADPADLEFLHAVVGPVVGAAVGAAMAGDVPRGFDLFMTAICGPEHRAVLTATLGPDGVARAEREAAFFFADEAAAVGEWPFDEAIAARVQPPALLVQGGASAPPVHRLVARVAALLPRAEVRTVDGEDHLLPLRSPGALAGLIGAAGRG